MPNYNDLTLSCMDYENLNPEVFYSSLGMKKRFLNLIFLHMYF